MKSGYRSVCVSDVCIADWPLTDLPTWEILYNILDWLKPSLVSLRGTNNTSLYILWDPSIFVPSSCAGEVLCRNMQSGP